MDGGGGVHEVQNIKQMNIIHEMYPLDKYQGVYKIDREDT